MRPINYGLSRQTLVIYCGYNDGCLGGKKKKVNVKKEEKKNKQTQDLENQCSFAKRAGKKKINPKCLNVHYVYATDLTILEKIA